MTSQGIVNGRRTIQCTLLSFIPAKCWMAPEIPTAIYNSCMKILNLVNLLQKPTCSNRPHSQAPVQLPGAESKWWKAGQRPGNKATCSRLTGATIFPVCPTCISLGTNPASTAALEAPTVREERIQTPHYKWGGEEGERSEGGKRVSLFLLHVLGEHHSLIPSLPPHALLVLEATMVVVEDWEWPA